MRDRFSIDMTHGPLLGKILRFSLPLMASNILQMLFSAADSVVVGRFAGHASLAAVGSTVGIIALFVNLLIGASVGVNVVIAHYLGVTGHDREISRSLHTAVTLALAGGVLRGGVGVLAADAALQLMSVPTDVRPLALLYVRIYFLGTPFTMLYNYGAAALRAKGDTQRPLLFLLLSGVLNLGLNLYFVIALEMDVAGVALATVISQGASAGLILRSLSRERDAFHFSWRQLCLDRQRLWEIARIGVPAGIQASLFSIANIAIQGAINVYGSVVMAGCSAAMSVENFLYLSMNAFQQACQTFTSQNLGAGEYERIGKVMRVCLSCTVLLGVVQSSAALVLSGQLIALYNEDPAVIAAGVHRLWTVASVYTLWGIADVLMGGIRGYGRSVAPMVINLLGTCGVRLVWISLLEAGTVDVAWVYASFPLSWVCVLSVLIPYWLILRRRTAPAQLSAGGAERPRIKRIASGEYAEQRTD